MKGYEMKKVYKCCICHKKSVVKPIKLIKMEYGIHNRNEFAQSDRYDICYNCYKIFNKWINKHKVK